MAATPPGPSGGQPQPVPYRNPLRGVRGLVPERIDMGVDYGGTGPIYALGPGVIENIWNAGWGPPAGVAPGAFISERLTAGPLAGRYVYAAEGIQPSVQVGQQVDSSTVIGQLTGGGIETGFAAPPGTGNALGASQFSGSNPTAYGAAYSKILTALGAPGGTGVSATVHPTGTNPGWLDQVLSGITGGKWTWLGGPGGVVAGGGAGGIGGAIGAIGTWLHSLDTAVAWLVNPSNWIRIFAGITGGFLVLGGVVVLSGVQARASASVPVVGGAASAVQTSMRLPMGMIMVGFGGVLLFIAFHNLPAGVVDIRTLLGYEGQQLAGATSGQSAAAGP